MKSITDQSDLSSQRRGFINIAVIILIIFVIGAAGYFVAMKDRKTPSSPPQSIASSTIIQTQTASSTSNVFGIEIYRDNLFGVEFKYPNNLSRRDAPNSSCFDGGKSNFCVTYYVAESGTALEKWVDDNYGTYHNLYSPVAKKPTSVSGYKALEITEQDSNDKATSTPGLVIGYGRLVVELYGKNIPQESLSSIVLTSPSIDLNPYALDVTWNSAQVQKLVAKEDLEARACIEGESYVVGKINNGAFAGDDLVARNQQFCGMDCGGLSENEFNYYVYHASRAISVGKGTGYTLKNLGAPDEIRVPNSTYVLKKDFASGFFDAEDIKSVLFQDSNAGKVYETKNSGCAVLQRNDHAQVYYSLDIPFINKENGEIDITLLNGKKFSDSYNLRSDWSCLPLAQQQFNESKDLVKIGQNTSNESIFALADQNSTDLKDIYNDQNTIARYEKTMPATYQGFLDTYPLLYWKDPFGRWIELKNKKYLAAAEKCKPVIYLYPQETMNVSVYVKPNGGFINTIPAYNDGWHVIAHPDGTIFDKETKVNYPYLYWSGWSIDVPSITKGWVIERKNIEKFLEERLAVLGLNKKEIADFNEYWVARLNQEGAPYYKIMFLTQDEFNNLASLRVEAEKRPDHVIRVVMYAQPSFGKETLTPQSLPKTPNRDGFTVVEWGGSLLK